MTAVGAPVLVVGPSIPSEIGLALELSGYTAKTAPSLVAAEPMAPTSGWTAVVVVAADMESALATCRAVASDRNKKTPVLLVLSQEQFGSLHTVEPLFDDFVLLPLRRSELEARLQRQVWAVSGGARPELVEYGALVLNLATYQASVAGRPLDMTYMEYELLKHFVTHPGRVLTRQELLRTVWGYEYYGGARTVDVHVRRLRAKLGEEHAALISTVRSVGYIFGNVRRDN